MSPLFFKARYMLIEYRANKMRREVRDSIAKQLIARRIATAVVETRQMTADIPRSVDDRDIEISPRTGKPKRQYKRRDMVPED